MRRFAFISDYFKDHVPRAAHGSPQGNAALAQSRPRAVDVDLALILDQIRKLVPGKTATDLSLSLSDGRALPDWLTLSDQRIITISTMAVPEIVLRLDAVYDDGHVGRFELVIDAKTRPMKVRVKKIEAISLAKLFSEDLLSDAPLERLKLPQPQPQAA